MSKKDFLLEIMVEEIPSRFQADAIDSFARLLISGFEKFCIDYESPVHYITPRRMIFGARLESKIPGFTEEKKGPQITALPEAISGFLKSLNISRDRCSERIIDKKTFLVANIVHDSASTADFLEVIVKSAITGIPWPKSMHWKSKLFRFVRPITNIMCMFGGKLVPVALDEIEIKSQDFTTGHLFMRRQCNRSPVPDSHDCKEDPACGLDRIYATNITEYIQRLRESFVVVDPRERKKMILQAFEQIERQYCNISLEVMDTLMDEIIGLVEYPVVFFADIPSKFMQLPEEVIIVPMRVHQRYFPLRARDSRKLAPHFVFVSNSMPRDNGDLIIRGNRRVLNARLEDALFFFETDLQKSLDTRLEDLKKIVFHEKLGTLFDRVERIESICGYLLDEISATPVRHQIPEHSTALLFSDNMKTLLLRAARLSKCDLATGMVAEFPELQGIIGGHYAWLQGEDVNISTAIADQYKAPKDIATSAPISGLLSLADKIDVITGFFAIGKNPTGSKDPFALRRAAIGLIKIILKFNLPINLGNVLRKTSERLAASVIETSHPSDDIATNVMSFILERLKIIMADAENVRPEVVGAVASSQGDIVGIWQTSKVLDKILKSDGGMKIMAIYRRARNILDSCAEEIDLVKGEVGSVLKQELLLETDERRLFDAIESLEQQLKNVSDGSGNESEKIQQKLNLCLNIEQFVTDFFSGVLVNAPEENIRHNRLKLLQKLVATFNSVLPFQLFCECHANYPAPLYIVPVPSK
ncbi:MAG: glycine--tRNA ligase subunit beta [Holosporaceae bacterium]|jgi:glycyl-tRNA synthetase beta chain|nr:glycine--tRNA ligase subunit beta [Holosporaceae bacterium]